MKVEETKDELVITLTLPRYMKGTYTYGEGEWEEDALCVWINEKHEDYSLNHTQYLDYKDALQATSPIVHFDDMKEALTFAEKYNLPVQYSQS
jgi:hypothetical protein